MNEWKRYKHLLWLRIYLNRSPEDLAISIPLSQVWLLKHSTNKIIDQELYYVRLV